MADQLPKVHGPAFDALKRKDQNLHPTAEKASPVILRALSELGKVNPNATRGVKPKEMYWDDGDAFSNIEAYTPTGTGWDGFPLLKPDENNDPNSIVINPSVSLGYPQKEVQRLLAHEVEHIGQNRGNTPADFVQQMKDQFNIPYEKQPHEQAARAAEKMYDIPRTQSYERVPDYVKDTIKSMSLARKKNK